MTPIPNPPYLDPDPLDAWDDDHLVDAPDPSIWRGLPTTSWDDPPRSGAVLVYVVAALGVALLIGYVVLHR